MKNIGIKEIKRNIPNDAFVSHIDGIIGNVKNVVFEGTFQDMHVYELERGMIVLFDFCDNTGTMKALMIGNRNNEFKVFLESLIMKHTYKVEGNIRVIEGIDKELPFTQDLLGKQLLCITAIDDKSSTKMFGEDILRLYDYDIYHAYDFVKKNTNYLDNILIDEIKDIKFSIDKIIILLKNGNVILDGDMVFSNIKLLVFITGNSILGISNDNEIKSIIGSDYVYKFMNNSHYKYKKIIVTPLIIVALTYEKSIKLYGTVCDGVIDYDRLINIEDIGYVASNDDIVVIKDGKPYSLFYEYNYDNKVPNVILDGIINDIVIIK